MILLSNIFWGRRSGKPKHTGKAQGAFTTPSFIQQQFGSGKSGSGKSFHSTLVNIPRKWFGVTYKSKRAPTPVAKGKKQ